MAILGTNDILQAADSVSTTFDDPGKLLERLGPYVKRLEVRVQAPMNSNARDIAIRALVEMLKAFAVATKMLRKNRAGMHMRSYLRPLSMNSKLLFNIRALPQGPIHKVE